MMLLSVNLSLVIGLITTWMLSGYSEGIQKIWAFLAWLPLMLLVGGFFLYMGGAILWVLWNSLVRGFIQPEGATGTM